MSTILITGAGGFLGRHTIKPLLQKGYKVIAVGRNPVQLEEDVEFVEVDLMDRPAIGRVLAEKKPENLLHLAWYLEPGKYAHSFLNKAWVESSLEILRQFSLNGGQRAVLAGTCFEYGFDDGPLDENDGPLKPNTYYGECKNELREKALALASSLNLSLAWGRIFYLYGPHEYESRLVASVITKLLKKEPAPCSEGYQTREFLHIQDVADAFCTLLESEITGPVNITTGKGHTIREIVTSIANITGVTELVDFGAFKTRPGDPQEVVGVPGKIQQLEWNPNFDLESGLRQTIDWWRREIHQGS